MDVDDLKARALALFFSMMCPTIDRVYPVPQALRAWFLIYPHRNSFHRGRTVGDVLAHPPTPTCPILLLDGPYHAASYPCGKASTITKRGPLTYGNRTVKIPLVLSENVTR